jgi:hypothetical protein
MPGSALGQATVHSFLYCEPVSALGPATLEHFLTPFGFHPLKKSMGTLSAQIAGLAIGN